MPPSRRALGGNAFQQLHVGEPQHPPVARQLQHDVQRGQRDDDRRGRGKTRSVRSRTATSAPATATSLRPCHAPASAARRGSTNRTMSAIQSRSVRSVSSGAPQLRIVRATSARCAAAALAKSSRSWASMVNSRVTPDSASCSMTSPTSGSSTSRGSSTSMASTSCRAAIARSGRIQLIGPRKSLMITAIPRRRSGRRSASMAVARSPRTPVGALGMVAIVRNIVCSMLAPGAGRHPGHRHAVGDQRADPVAAAAVEEGDRGRGRHRQVALLATGRAEVQAGRQVDHHPGLQFAVGDHLPDMRVGGACGHRPVHPAHVVAGLVLARLPRLRTGTRDQAEMVAVQDAVELAFDRELEVTSAPPSASGRRSARAASTADEKARASPRGRRDLLSVTDR